MARHLCSLLQWQGLMRFIQPKHKPMIIPPDPWRPCGLGPQGGDIRDCGSHLIGEICIGSYLATQNYGTILTHRFLIMFSRKTIQLWVFLILSHCSPGLPRFPGPYLIHPVEFVRTTDQQMTCLRSYNPTRVAGVMDRWVPVLCGKIEVEER